MKDIWYPCDGLRCLLARLSGLQCFYMGHNCHRINLYGVIMTLMGNLHAGGQSSQGHLSLLHPHPLIDHLYMRRAWQQEYFAMRMTITHPPPPPLFTMK